MMSYRRDVQNHALSRLARPPFPAPPPPPHSRRGPDALLAVKHRPADVVPQPLVVEYELADRLRELVALPPALESPCALALSFRRGGTRGLDRIGGRTELVRRDVCDDRRLAGGVRGMAWRATQISGRRPCMASCRAPRPARVRSRDAVAGPQAEPTRRSLGRVPRTMPPRRRGDGDPNQ